MIMVKPGRRSVPVPDHTSLKPGTLRGILAQTGISVDELLELIDR